MPESIQIDVQLTPKLWLPDERAWRVSALNIPGGKRCARASSNSRPRVTSTIIAGVTRG